MPAGQGADGRNQGSEERLRRIFLEKEINVDTHLESEIIDIHHATRLEVGEAHTTKAFLDSGAMEYNFISYKLAYEQNLQCFVIPNIIKVQTINGITEIKRFVMLNKLTLTYKQTKKRVLYNVICLVLPHSPVDVIIGLPTIRQYDSTKAFRPYFILRNRRVLRANESYEEFRARLIRKYQEIKHKASHAGANDRPFTTDLETRDPSAASLALFTAEASSSPGVVTQTMEGRHAAPMLNSNSPLSVRTVIDKTKIFDGGMDDDEVDLLVRPTGWDTYFARTQQAPSLQVSEGVSINNDLSAAEKNIILTAINKYRIDSI